MQTKQHTYTVDCTPAENWTQPMTDLVYIKALVNASLIGGQSGGRSTGNNSCSLATAAVVESTIRCCNGMFVSAMV